MPFLIACWPFKLTAGYTAKGFSMLLNSFFVFVFMGLVVSVNIQLVDTALMQTAVSDDARTEKAVTLSAEQEKRMTELCSSNQVQASTGKLWRESAECKKFASRQDNLGALQLIYDAINTQDDNKLKELTDISSLGFIILIICCIFGFKLCGEAVSLASQMSGGQGGSIGSHIASLGAGAAKWGAVNTGKAVGKTAKSFGKASGVNDKIRQGKEVVGRKMYNGMAAVGRRLGLKGAAGSNGVQSSGNDNGGGNMTAQNRGGNTVQNRSGQRTPGEAANMQNAAAGQAGGEEGTATAGTTVNNAQPNNQNGGLTGQGRDNDSAGSKENGNRSGAAAGTGSGAVANVNSGVQNPESGDGQNADNGQNAGTGSEGQPANDGGASSAGPRDNNVQEQANQIVNSSKEKIAAAAQNTAAEKGGSSGKPGKVESPNKNGKKDDKKGNAAEKKAQAQIEELQRVISGLELEKKELEKQLRNLGGKPAVGNAAGSDDELQKKMKKLEEDKQKAESLLEALKNQK